MGFWMAFAHAPSTEKLTNRAKRHLSISPAQSVLDYTSALNAAIDNLTKSNVLVGRGEALMKLNKFPTHLLILKLALTYQSQLRVFLVDFGMPIQKKQLP